MIRQAVFLIGGMGTRLKERTLNTPKPLLNVGGRPFIEYLLDEAARHGFTDILLLAGHLGDQFEALYGGKTWRGAKIRVLREPSPLGTGGALRFALPQLDQHFLLSNGDSFFDINLRRLTQPSNLKRAKVIMALRAGANDTRYGRVSFIDGYVCRFFAPQEGIDGPINTGIYCMNRDVVAGIPESLISLEGMIFPGLSTAGEIAGEQFEGYFIDIGVPADFVRAEIELPQLFKRPAVFFDRDGVLNRDDGYVQKPEEFFWLKGAKDAIRWCNDHGVLAFVVTNQAGVARGFYSEEDVHALHDWITEELDEIGAHVDEFEYCPHHIDGNIAQYRKACRRRKPEAGMITDILAKWRVDLARSFLVGDKESDTQAALAAGIRSYRYDGSNLKDLVSERSRP